MINALTFKNLQNGGYEKDKKQFNFDLKSDFSLDVGIKSMDIIMGEKLINRNLIKIANDQRSASHSPTVSGNYYAIVNLTNGCQVHSAVQKFDDCQNYDLKISPESPFYCPPSFANLTIQAVDSQEESISIPLSSISGTVNGEVLKFEENTFPISVPIEKEGKYRILATLGNGCKYDLEKVVKSEPSPMNNGFSVEKIADPATYQFVGAKTNKNYRKIEWDFGDGTHSISQFFFTPVTHVFPESKGHEYEINLTVEGLCGGRSVHSSKLAIGGSASRRVLGESFVYPNPVSARQQERTIIIKNNNFEENKEAQIRISKLSSDGKEVQIWAKSTKDKNIILKIPNNLKPDYYILKIKTAQGESTAKLNVVE